MVKKNGTRSNEINALLFRGAMLLACGSMSLSGFLTKRQLDSIEATLEKLAAKSEAVAIDVATLKAEVRIHDSEIYKRLPRP